MSTPRWPTPIATRRRRIAVTSVWAAATAGAIAFVLTMLGLEGEGDVAFALLLVLLAADVMVYASVGAVLALRRPDNQIASVLLAAAALLAATFLGFLYGAATIMTIGPADPLGGIASLVGGLALFPALVLAGPALALVFPDGHLPGPRWRWAVALIAAVMTLGLVLIAARPGPVSDGLAENPIGIAGESWVELGDIGLSLALLALVASLLLGVIAVIARYRRGSGLERAQLRWFLAANVATAVFVTLSFADGGGDITAFDILFVLSLSLPPLAVGVAVLRYRLYEIDRIISRGIAYGLLTAVLIATYAASILLLQGPLGAILGGDTVAVALSTLVVAALFQPLRGRVQGMVDQRFDRARFDADRTSAAFSERLRDEVDIGTVTADLDRTVQDALKPAAIGLWLRNAERAIR